MTHQEAEVENEIEKLNQEIDDITCAIDDLSKAKTVSEAKLKEELKKAKEISRMKNQKVDRYNSKTMEYLETIERLYSEMYNLHDNNEVMEQAKAVVENYKIEFEGLVKLYEDVNAIDPNRPPVKKFPCVCKTGFCEPPRPSVLSQASRQACRCCAQK